METSDLVREFHSKFGYPVDRTLPAGIHRELWDLSAILRSKSEQILERAKAEAVKGDDRLYRAHLILEEVAELFSGMEAGNRIETADALADLVYVVVGTAVNFGFPLERLVQEVHRSNMTRQRVDFRMRDKGEGFSKPDIQGVLDGR